MPSEHRKQLRAGAARPQEVLHAEVRVERVTEPHAPAERQPLARGVGDGVAEARAAQELGGREGLPVVQHDPLAPAPSPAAAPGTLPPIASPPILRRVVPVAPPGQRLHHMHELSRKALID